MDFITNFSEAFDYAINSDSEDAAQNFLLSQMYYFKPVYGTMQRDGEETPRIFTDECEWRYIPDLSSLNLPQAVSEQDIQSINTLNKTLDLSKESWLNFNFDEIKEQLNMLYVKHALLTAKKMYDEGDCISDNEITIAF